MSTEPESNPVEEAAPSEPAEVIEFFADDPLFATVARETAPHAAQH